MNEQTFPPDRSYTRDHEWIDIPPGGPVPGGPVLIGLSAQAVEALGDIVHLDLPEPGTALTAGDSCGEVESTKSVSDLVSPVTGSVAAVNPSLAEDPSAVNRDPYGEGWLFTANVTALGDLLTAEEYRAASADA